MRHLSLCTGYGGIDLALAEVLGARTSAVADVDPGACKILAHRFSYVPNLGDITTVDWNAWRDIELISGGTPCQDLSHAGRRAGMTEGTRSNLWVAMREAIAVIRPQLVCWENVRGAYSAAADSSLEPCTGCVGDGTGVHLRALGRVLGDLSSLGYDACWYGLRASDVGAAHHRYRVFVFAWPADGADALRSRLARRSPVIGRTSDHAAGGSSRPCRMMPTPNASLIGPHGERGARSLVSREGRQVELPDVVGYLPTPAVANRDNRSMSAGAALRPGLETIAHTLPSPRTSDTNGAGAHGDGGPDLRTAVTFLPTTTRQDGSNNGGPSQADRNTVPLNAVQDWREYEPAIRRQEQAFGRPAPLPTEPGKTGKPRLSARFSEWLMGAPDGWITDVPGITRNEALKACGNGVVPAQCAAASRRFISDFTRYAKEAA